MVYSVKIISEVKQEMHPKMERKKKQPPGHYLAISIGNHMRPSTIKEKLPESRSDEGNLENFENSSAINPY